MKIGIVLHPYGEEKPAGLGRAILELTRSLIAAYPEHEYTIFLKDARKLAPHFSGNVRVETLGGGIFWRERMRAMPRLDAYLFNTPVLPLFFCPQKSVVIALDFAYLYERPRGVRDLARHLLLTWYHARSLRRADRIIAISEATKKDIIKFFGIRDERISVVYLGVRDMDGIVEERCAAPEKFFLYVGVLKERKNVERIIGAFARAASRVPQHHLILAGKGEGAYPEKLRRRASEGAAAQRIHFVGYVTDGERAYLYRRTTACIFPSIIEGFGFPVLEAMSAGAPVVTSNVSSLPELAGDAAVLVNPLAEEEIASAMVRLATDETLRRECIRKGRMRSRLFSWEKAARECMKILL